MNLIDATKKEKEILRNIALKLINENKGCLIKSEVEAADSYYQQVSRNQDEYLMTYAFDTIVELRTELTKLWESETFMHEFIPVILASAFKKRPDANEDRKPSSEQKDGNNDDILPTYTYTM